LYWILVRHGLHCLADAPLFRLVVDQPADPPLRAFVRFRTDPRDGSGSRTVMPPVLRVVWPADVRSTDRADGLDPLDARRNKDSPLSTSAGVVRRDRADLGMLHAHSNRWPKRPVAGRSALALEPERGGHVSGGERERLRQRGRIATVAFERFGLLPGSGRLDRVSRPRS